MPRPTLTAREAKALGIIKQGVNEIYDSVKVTIGPEGKNALIYGAYGRPPRMTNDGVTIAEVIEPKNPLVRLAASSFKEGCKKTVEKVGDGTTATTVIGGKLFNDGYNLLLSTKSSIGGGSNVGVMTIKKNILATADSVKKKIKESAKKIETLEELEKIATVSVQDSEKGKIIAKMAWDTGVDGYIDVVEGYKGVIETEVIKGMRFPAKIVAKAFLNNPSRYEMVAEDCQVIMTNYALDNVKEASDYINTFLKVSPKLIVIAPSFSQQVIEDIFKAMFTIGPNGRPVRKPGVDIFPVKVPSFRTEQFEDFAVYCGAKFVDKQKGMKLKNVRPEDAGFLQKLVIKDVEAKEDAIATGGAGANVETGIKVGDEEVKTISKVQERIDILKAQLEETREPQFKEILKRRIASMTSAVGVIKVGDSTRAESYYQKMKIEDAVGACKAALRGGYVKGGGLCLKEIADTLPDDDLLKGALLAPYEQIQASVDGGIEITDYIIDPMEVVYYAVEHSTQIASNLLTAGVIVVEEEDYSPNDGQRAIASAISEYTKGWQKKEGIWKENEDEMRADSEARDESIIADYERS